MTTSILLAGRTYMLPTDFVGADGYGYAAIWTQFWTDVASELGFARGLAVTSSSATTPGTGSKTFATVPSTTVLPLGAIVRAASLGAPDHWMVGNITASSAGSVTINVTSAAGGTSRTDWVIGNVVTVGDVPRWKIVASTASAAHGQRILADTSAGAFTITLAAAPSNGDVIEIADAGRDWQTNNLTIAGNGKNIEGGSTLVCDVAGASFALRYNGTEWTVTA